MNTTQTQALAPSSTHPCCRDGSGHTNALPRDDQACISDEHTVELTTEAHVRLARGSIWKRCCGSATRGEPPCEISKRDIPIASLRLDEALELGRILTGMVLASQV